MMITYSSTPPIIFFLEQTYVSPNPQTFLGSMDVIVSYKSFNFQKIIYLFYDVLHHKKIKKIFLNEMIYVV